MCGLTATEDSVATPKGWHLGPLECVAALRARVAELEAAAKRRSVVCGWCGKAWARPEDGNWEPVWAEARDHDQVCARNPLVARVAELETQLGIRRAPESTPPAKLAETEQAQWDRVHWGGEEP